MRERGMGRVDEKNTVHFCGLIQHPENGSIVFLPREAKTGNPVIDLETASLTMRALARFGAETSKRDFENDGEAGNPGTLAVIKRLADDFRDHGLFSERSRQRTRNAGKSDWTRTVKREIALPNLNGQPVFTDIRTSRTIRSTDALLAQIQAAVIREIRLSHAWWLTGTSGRAQELLSTPRPPFPSLKRTRSVARFACAAPAGRAESVNSLRLRRHTVKSMKAAIQGSGSTPHHATSATNVSNAQIAEFAKLRPWAAIWSTLALRCVLGRSPPGNDCPRCSASASALTSTSRPRAVRNEGAGSIRSRLLRLRPRRLRPAPLRLGGRRRSSTLLAR